MAWTPLALVQAFCVAACLLSATLAQAVEPPRIIDSYVLFAYDEMILKGATGASPRGNIRRSVPFFGPRDLCVQSSIVLP